MINWPHVVVDDEKKLDLDRELDSSFISWKSVVTERWVIF